MEIHLPQMYHQMCDVKTMSYIVFISRSLHWRYIKTALQEYVTIIDILYLDASRKATGSFPIKQVNPL